MRGPDSNSDTGIAITGMACRVPGAHTPDSYWENLRRGLDSVRETSPEEGLSTGQTSDSFGKDRYTPRRGALDGIALFDANYFGIIPREAEALDPQQRIFLEVAVEALENAGHDPARFNGRIGVFAGAELKIAYSNPAAGEVGEAALPELLDVEQAHFATRVAYRLHLDGPTRTVQATCATGLVAVHMAVQSLLSGECDMAVVGAISAIELQHKESLHESNGMLSPDGKCRAFSTTANGVANGSGAVVLVLRRNKDAERDADTIHALIKGSAINNEGPAGRSVVIREALGVAGVKPSEITYIEAHGTGISGDDQREIADIKAIFDGDRAAPLMLGSVKTNIGHLGVASGAAGMLKAVFVVSRGEVPPHLHCELPIQAAREADLLINNGIAPVRLPAGPIRAGISAFGVDGTNVHVVIEASPATAQLHQEREEPQLVVLSAKTETALSGQIARLRRYLENSNPLLSDVALTLQEGRGQFAHRLALTCISNDDLRAALAAPVQPRKAQVNAGVGQRVVFVFPGGGVQYPGMGRELYRCNTAFRNAVDECRAILQSLGAEDVLPAFLAAQSDEKIAAEIRPPSRSGVCIFVYQYATVCLLKSIGITPDIVMGHSLGEYACAVASGALLLKDALMLMQVRGTLLEKLEDPGAMLLVQESESVVKGLLEEGTVIVALNGPHSNGVAGSRSAIDTLAKRFDAQGITYHRIRYGAASHCHLVEPLLSRFEKIVANCQLRAPRITWMSTVTAKRHAADIIVGTDYWRRQFREPVRFAEAVCAVTLEGPTLFVELGPHNGLTNLIKSNVPSAAVVSFGQHASDIRDGYLVMLDAVGALWLRGVNIDWKGLRSHNIARRIPLPTYAFDHVPHHHRLDGLSRARSEIQIVHQPADSTLLPASWTQVSSRSDIKARPETDVEYIVRGVWQEMLGREYLGLTENFFDLGGHSLLAVRINSELRAFFELELPLNLLFENPTVQGLAAAIMAAGQACNVDVETIAKTFREVGETPEEDLAFLTSEGSRIYS